MGTQIEWRYLGTPESPSTIRLGGKTISRGACISLPKDFDFTKEYGSDIRQALRIVRVSPPAGPIKPLSRVLDEWKAETKKPTKRTFLPDGP
jgi:hypothetical protein